MSKNPYLSSFVNEPVLVSVDAGDRVTAMLHQVQAVSGELNARAGELASGDFWPEPGSYLSMFRPYIVKDGILHIPVKGVLLHDFAYQFFSYATGYVYIQKAIERGLADAGVRGIALVIDSPGGQVAGNFDLVDYIYESRSQKSIQAFATEHAYSAAYSIASAASKITVARTGGVGSIGVVTSHTDMSKWLDDVGLKITFIHAGKHKVDGNSAEPLSPGAKERIQSRINALYDVFVATVARNRGMDESAVRATEALTFTAAEALSNKLADTIGSLDDGLAAFAVDLNPNEGETEMSKTSDTATVDQATVDAAREEGRKTGHAEGHAEGVKAENTRIAGIMALEESKTRVESALTIALTTQLTVDQAKGVLATLPESTKAEATKGSTFDKAMIESGNPEVGAAAEKAETSDSDDIIGAYRAAGGIGLKKQ